MLEQNVPSGNPLFHEERIPRYRRVSGGAISAGMEQEQSERSIAQQHLHEFIEDHARGDDKRRAEIVNEIAGICGVSRRYVDKWRTGKAPIGDQYIPLLAKYFRTSAAWFHYGVTPLDDQSIDLIQKILTALIENEVLLAPGVSVNQITKVVRMAADDREHNGGRINHEKLYDYIQLMVRDEVPVTPQ